MRMLASLLVRMFCDARRPASRKTSGGVVVVLEQTSLIVGVFMARCCNH
jgi:hypothetical protein